MTRIPFVIIIALISFHQKHINIHIICGRCSDFAARSDKRDSRWRPKVSVELYVQHRFRFTLTNELWVVITVFSFMYRSKYATTSLSIFAIAMKIDRVWVDLVAVLWFFFVPCWYCNGGHEEILSTDCQYTVSDYSAFILLFVVFVFWLSV